MNALTTVVKYNFVASFKLQFYKIVWDFSMDGSRALIGGGAYSYIHVLPD